MKPRSAFSFSLSPALALSCTIAVLSGCASINSVSLTSIPAKKGPEITAERSKMIFLGLNFDNDYVNEMTDDLKAQCRDGQVKGILTKDESIMYFLFFLYRRKVTAYGYCQRGKSSIATAAKATTTDGSSMESSMETFIHE